MALTEAQLRALNVATTFSNANRLVLASAQQAFFDEMITAMYPSVSEIIGSTPGYNPTFPYQPGPDVYVMFNSRLWKFVSTTENTGVEPGTDIDVWLEIGISLLAHPQNTDYKLQVVRANIDQAGGVIDMTDPNLSRHNLLFIAGTAPNQEFSIQTLNMGSGVRSDHDIYVYAPATAIKFVNDANQEIPGGELTLDFMDWALFKHIGGVTRVVASSKLQGPGGVGGNPFDQNLNTTSDVTFNTTKITQRAGTGTRAAVYDADGNLLETEIKDIADVVFGTIKIIDQATALETQWQVINGVFTNVTP